MTYLLFDCDTAIHLPARKYWGDDFTLYKPSDTFYYLLFSFTLWL